MIVGFDATAAVGEFVSGVGYHIVRLLEHMDAEAPSDVEFRVFFQAVDAAQRQRATARLPSSRRMRLVPVPFVETKYFTLHRAFRAFVLPAAAALNRCDIFHGPAHIVPPIRRIPTVVTIHDLAFFKHELYAPSFSAALRQFVSESIRSASAVIALSKHTEQDIFALLGRRDQVHVIYGAGNYATVENAQRQPSDRSALDALGIGGPYVLYVGDFNPRKNLPYLVQSFGAFKRDSDVGDVQLVLVGNSTTAKDALQATAREAGLGASDVVLTGRISDALLPVLYRNASTFALTSLVEGFTLVTLEAMSYGVPVVATNTSSIAEGTGTAAELVPLDDAMAVARALRTGVMPGARRDEMIRLGSERVAKFNWGVMARQTLAVYDGLVAARRTDEAGRPAGEASQATAPDR